MNKSSSLKYLLFWIWFKKAHQNKFRKDDFEFNSHLDIKNLYKCVDWYKKNYAKEWKDIDFELWGNSFVLLTASVGWVFKGVGFTSLIKKTFAKFINNIEEQDATIVGSNKKEVKQTLNYYLVYLEYIEDSKQYPILFKQEKQYSDKAWKKFIKFSSKFGLKK